MALLSLSLISVPRASILSSVSSSTGCSDGPDFFRPPQTYAYLMLPSRAIVHNAVSLNRRKSQVVRMAPEEEKLTRRSPLDFPIEWERPRPGRRPDIFPQFSPMKTPLPPPLPADPPPEEDEEEEEKQDEEEEEEKEKEEEGPEKEEPELPERTQ